jgi:hypothetical protein
LSGSPAKEVIDRHDALNKREGEIEEIEERFIYPGVATVLIS